MDRPIVSQAAERIYERLAPVAAQDEQTGWQLLRFVDAVVTSLQGRLLDWVSETDEHVSWGMLLDADEAPPEALPWLAQFVGEDLSDDMTVADQRTAIKTHAGFDRGTPAAMAASVRRLLTGSQHVEIIERAGDDPYLLAVVTYTAETPDEDRVMAALLKHKPAGVVMIYAVVDGQTYNAIESGYDDYADLLGTYPSYQSVLLG